MCNKLFLSGRDTFCLSKCNLPIIITVGHQLVNCSLKQFLFNKGKLMFGFLNCFSPGTKSPYTHIQIITFTITRLLRSLLFGFLSCFSPRTKFHYTHIQTVTVDFWGQLWNPAELTQTVCLRFSCGARPNQTSSSQNKSWTTSIPRTKFVPSERSKTRRNLQKLFPAHPAAGWTPREPSVSCGRKST